MRTVKHSFLLAVTLAACGGGDATPDAPVIVLEPDAAEVGPPTTITIDTVFDPPELVAVRDGLTAAWTILPVGGTSYTATVHGPYMATVVCDDRIGGISVYQFVRTPDDERLLEAFCFSSAGGKVVPEHQVTGQVVQPGTVILGFQSQSSDVPNWQLDLTTTEGTYDMVALSADRVRVDRDILVDAAKTLPAIDTGTGDALVAAPLTATNALAGETLRANLSLFTMNSFGFNVVTSDAADVKVLPDSVLVGSDRQRVSLAAFAGFYSRSNRKTNFHAGDPTVFTLPDPITGAAFSVANGVVTAAWATLPSHDSLTASLFACATDACLAYVYQELSVGPSVEASKKVSLDNADIPGFKAEWKVDTTKEYFRTLSAFESRAGETSSATYDEPVNFNFDFIARTAPAKLETLRELRTWRAARRAARRSL